MNVEEHEQLIRPPARVADDRLARHVRGSTALPLAASGLRP